MFSLSLDDIDSNQLITLDLTNQAEDIKVIEEEM